MRKHGKKLVLTFADPTAVSTCIIHKLPVQHASLWHCWACFIGPLRRCSCQPRWKQCRSVNGTTVQIDTLLKPAMLAKKPPHSVLSCTRCQLYMAHPRNRRASTETSNAKMLPTAQPAAWESVPNLMKFALCTSLNIKALHSYPVYTLDRCSAGFFKNAS